MGLITGLLLYDIASSARKAADAVDVQRYTKEEETAIGMGVLVGVFATLFWPFAIAWPLALRKNRWCFGYLAVGAVLLIVSPFNYIATGLLAGLAWACVFCWWIQYPGHIQPMISWYFNSQPRVESKPPAEPSQPELPFGE